MAIKNKDGSTYELTKPNPIMKNQTCDWDKVIVHNFSYGDTTTYESDKEKEKEDLVIIPVVEKKEEIVREKLVAWCLPAYIEEFDDPLYHEKKRRIKYKNKKFSFEVAIIKQEDLFCQFWTNSVTISEKSIIYVQQRWWKAEKITETKDGITIDCSPSDQTPKFDY